MSESNTYQNKRELFGQKVNFKSKEETDFRYLCFKPDPSAEKFFEKKNPKSITLSNIPEKSSHLIHTEKTKTRPMLVKHLEGGWPDDVKDINSSDNKDINSWKKKKERPDEFPIKVKILIANTTSIIKQNQRMDIYEEYFDDNEQAVNEDNFSAKIKTVFKDTEPYARSVQKIAWSNDEEQNRIAVAYRLHKGQHIPTNYKLPCLVWSIDKPNEPLNKLTHSSEIFTVAFNPKIPNILGVGCANGTAAIFDLTTSKLICASRLEESHSETISDFVWQKTKNGTEFVTTSTDGKVIWWEIKNLGSIVAPFPTIEHDMSLTLIDKEDSGKEYGGMKIEYNPEAGSNKFLIGTEQGTIFLANKKKTDAEISLKLGFKWGRHLGPITGMQRCPAATKFILTVGDWTARIWPDDSKIPVIITKYLPAYLTDCTWSPSRQGLFFVSRSDGWINAYDLCYKVNDSAFGYKVSDCGITSIGLNFKGDKLIVGDEEGKVSLIKLSKSFYIISDNEKKRFAISELFEREALREKNLDKKKPVLIKDDSSKLSKQEQLIKEKIAKIEETYIPFVSNIFHRSDFKE